ncbi:hypothetical protein VTJ04DRAFT_3387 [Mycothermus thermophilus]|uniref:uncharacterized protein n=1 Tax=Humicola insolens TaxID=85995 RepID=UPI00374219EF
MAQTGNVWAMGRVSFRDKTKQTPPMRWRVVDIRWKETEWNKLHPGFTHNQPGMLPALYSVSRFADADAPRCHAQIDRGASMKP